jgi:hypothetical protein
MEHVCLKHDNGNDLSFKGHLFSECSWFDEESGTLTRQKLYQTESGDRVYHVVRTAGKTTTRNAFRLSVREGDCVIFNGTSEMALPLDMLELALRKLCGIEDGKDLSIEVDDYMPKAANG